MPRKLRVQDEGALSHVMSRGDRREDIFHNDVGRQDFFKTLAEACQKTDLLAHACCLTPLPLKAIAAPVRLGHVQKRQRPPAPGDATARPCDNEKKHSHP